MARGVPMACGGIVLEGKSFRAAGRRREKKEKG
jgi:hypothetical protein